VRKQWRPSWTLILLAGGLWAGALGSPCHAQVNLADEAVMGPAKKPSMFSSFSNSVKKGFGKLTNSLTPEPLIPSEADPTSLNSRATPGPEVYTAVGRLYMQSKRYDEAEEHFRKALAHSPDYLPTLLAFAELKDRLGDTQQAAAYYQQAANQHPDQPSVYNNWGSFYARHRQLDNAVTAISRAVQLRPREAKYRNNLAVILVEAGRPAEALVHLRAVHSGAVAHYNLGYLLYRKGQHQAAAGLFSRALQFDPSMAPARQMLSRLQGPPSPPAPTTRPSNPETQQAARPAPSLGYRPQPQWDATPSRGPAVAPSPAPSPSARIAVRQPFGSTGRSSSSVTVRPSPADSHASPPTPSDWDSRRLPPTRGGF